MMSEAEPPREGLPPCLRYAVFEDRRAIMHLSCPEHRNPESRYYHIACGPLERVAFDYQHGGRQIYYPWGNIKNIITLTDDPAEAEAAWERAQEWVRTGELE